MKHTQVSSGRLSVRAIGNFVKWLYDRLSVVKDEGRDPTATSLMWFLDKSNHMSRRKDLKNVGGTLVMSFSPRNMVLTVSFKWRKLTSSNSAISFLKLKKKNITFCKNHLDYMMVELVEYSLLNWKYIFSTFLTFDLLDYFSNHRILIEIWIVSISTSELYSDKPSGNFIILVGNSIYDWKA